MDPGPPISFASPAALGAALAVAAIAAVVALLRRPDVPRLTYAIIALGLLLFALAAGGPTWHRPATAEVAVMVDLSPSTRGAEYRQSAALRQRVNELLGDTPHRLVYFASESSAPPFPAGSEPPSILPDLPADRTTFAPPAAPAVVLFSDGRFEPPAWAPPTFVIVDPALESPNDAAIERLEVRPGEVAITTRNSGSPRLLTLTGVEGTAAATAPTGTVVLVRPLPAATPAATVAARLSPGDAWPENDALTAVVPLPAEAERWWVGGARPTGGEAWRILAPADLPLDAAGYLAPSVVVLDNVPAEAVPEPARQRLAQYVRDLGGGLVILGGDGAFAAGEYAGTALEALSPLASTPPEPSAHWVVLVDSSGSMNAPAGANAGGGATRWRVAAEAAATTVRSLPPDDRVSVGGFAAAVRWWARDRAAADVAREPIPPAGAGPSGPTELRRAVEEAAATAGPFPPTQLILLTDGNAEIGDAVSLAGLLRRRNVRLHLLAIGAPGDAAAAGLTALRRVVDSTGGSLLEETDPSRWAAAARRLLRGVTPDLLRRDTARLTFSGDLLALPPRDVALWNRTWEKPGATPLARLDPAGGTPVQAVARWQLGEGATVAAAFPTPTPREVSAFVRLVERPPRDPRLRVTWDGARRLHVVVDALEGTKYLNGLSLSLHLADAARADRFEGRTIPIPQTAPGRYEVTLDAPASPTVAMVRLAGAARPIDRAVIAGRYAAEFDAVGLDRRAMRDLADRTGGALVEPSAHGRLTLPRPRRPVSLAALLAAAAAACVALGLIWWRRS